MSRQPGVRVGALEGPQFIIRDCHTGIPDTGYEWIQEAYIHGKWYFKEPRTP